MIAILKGSFIFAADLIRAMHEVGLAPEVEFIALSSYGAGTYQRRGADLRTSTATSKAATCC